MEQENSTDWLLAGPAWVQYRARVDLLGENEKDPQMVLARRGMIAGDGVQSLMADLACWPGPALKGANDAGHLLHKLSFIADLGIRREDGPMESAVSSILSHHSPEGPFQVRLNISPSHGGTGEDQMAWILSNTPTVLYALLKLGLQDNAEVQAAVHYLVSLVRENGWPCVASPELGKFRGPGRKNDPCPYATLLMLKVLAEAPGWRDSEACRIGVETLLGLWEQRRERRPYLFAMGTDFRKLKAPLVWYDILHVVDVLTRFPWLRSDPRLQEMAGIVRQKADDEGRFTAESVWRVWGEWEFGQKRSPSRWITLLAQRILRRMEEI